jgi:hypothetical protein
MANESKAPQEHISDALDIMVKAGWVRQHARNVKTGIGVDWTEEGKQAIEALWLLISELGAENLNMELWWAVRTIAIMRFNPPS